ncbi:phosphatidylinositol mannoside acyltransferase [Solihabitans fulvus]|uniref:Phosphatidylinositol mannoside acyltransferase n=1 Tax=Solihabitans fulvus TaxID=1892852 RepID=A0A5B2WYM6_9PSEU|nr:phosphatidylinositol mannoside acyltransferase [Solihabitans fulvus]KAA2256118.1 phosphatidylinositol mannoside acyltransferase [Solihabitans fulvus]
MNTSWRATLGERLTVAGYTAGWRLVRALPEGVAGALFRKGADLAARRGGEGTAQLRRNLARVVPKAGDDELDELVQQSLRSYARYWREAFRLPSMQVDAVFRLVDEALTGRENLDAALAEGNGAICVLPHSGNWDVAGVWGVRHVGTFTTVAERLKPEELYQRFFTYRESLGFEILPTKGGPRPASAVLADRLRANGLVCLVADRDLTSAGVPVSFFGEEARMPAGPAHLAATTGAALLPVGSWFTEQGWGLRIHPPIKVAGQGGVAAATQAMADVFAADIAAHPADWHMLQKVWVADLPPGRQAVLARVARRNRERAEAAGLEEPR